MAGWYFFRASALLLLSSLLPLLSGCGRNTDEALPLPLRPAEPGSSQTTSAPSPAPASAVAKSALPEDGSTEERIKAVILQNTAARQGISSYVMDIEWENRRFADTPLERPLPEGDVYSRGEGTWTWQDGKWRVHQRNRMDAPDASASYAAQRRQLPSGSLSVQQYSLWVVYNGDYFARKNSQAEFTLYLYPKDFIDAGFDPKSYLFPYPMQFAYGIGIGGKYFDEIYEMSEAPAVKPYTRWTLGTLDFPEGQRLKLSRIVEIETGTQRTEFLIDPERDFLVVGWNSWSISGQWTDEYAVDLQQLEDGRWFPLDARWRQRDDFKRYRFSNVSFNVALDNALFNLESIPFDPVNTRLMKREVDRSDKAYLFRDGQWIPESLVPRHLRPVRGSNEEGGKFGRAKSQGGSK